MTPPLRRKQNEPDQPDAGVKASPASNLKRSVLEATNRIQGIVDMAECAAAEIRAEAEAEAERYLATRRAEADRLVEVRAREITELLAPLLDAAGRLRADAEQLASHADRTLAAVRGSSAAEPVEAPSRSRFFERRPPPPHEPDPPPEVRADPPPAPRPPPEPTAYPGTAATPVEEPAAPAPEPELPVVIASEEAALLRATQMAVAGSGREEIAAALRDKFGIADPGPVVERVLGSG